jgi:hypothetical protein
MLNTLKRRRKAQAALAAALLATLVAAPAQACIPGGAVRCAASRTLDPDARVAPLSRADIDALVAQPGPAVTEAVRRDTARAWDTVRRQSLPPAVALPAGPSQQDRKGDAP